MYSPPLSGHHTRLLVREFHPRISAGRKITKRIKEELDTSYVSISKSNGISSGAFQIQKYHNRLSRVLTLEWYSKYKITARGGVLYNPSIFKCHPNNQILPHNLVHTMK